jgi:hypothetical protein
MAIEKLMASHSNPIYCLYIGLYGRFNKKDPLPKECLPLRMNSLANEIQKNVVHVDIKCGDYN